tara:strand:- start:235 stop:537 length:303 start_codon:yes stop_codon:yes gene_type:complete
LVLILDINATLITALVLQGCITPSLVILIYQERQERAPAGGTLHRAGSGGNRVLLIVLLLNHGQKDMYVRIQNFLQQMGDHALEENIILMGGPESAHQMV